VVAIVAAVGVASATSIPVRTARAAPAKIDPNGASSDPSASANGHQVAFVSHASNLGPPDPNGQVPDIYLFNADTATVTLVSAAVGGAGADGASSEPSISADGTMVAFASHATNLVPGGTQGHHENIFVRRPGGTILISRSSSGGPANGDSSQPVLSADGHYLAFTSTASNLVPGDSNKKADVFICNLVTAQIRAVSVTGGGNEGNGPSTNPAISADGRFVSFDSAATNLAAGIHNHVANVFVRDTSKGKTRLVSVSSTGRAQNAAVSPPYSQISALSADGRYVVFDSSATNLAPGAKNGYTAVFRRDLRTRHTILVSRSTLGAAADNDSFAPSVSADGNDVAFDSYASNLAQPWAPVANVFVRDISHGTTLTVDVAPDGGPRAAELHTNFLQRPAISADGRVVAFASGADNLVAGDHNGVADVFTRVIAPPTTTLVGKPQSTTSNRTPMVEFRGDDPLAKFGLCVLDRSRKSCPAGRMFALPRLRKGHHTLKVFAGGPGILFDPTGASVSFTVS
jgi:Tol biopolymer transport system component